jgi:hypothetical protein
VGEYLLAANGLAAAGNYHEAGALLRDRARRPELALEFFRGGWAGRPQGGAVACLVAITELYAGHDSPAALLDLTGEADAFFALPGNEVGAGQFYNRLAELAGLDHLASVRDELRDRALRGLALKLRQRAGAEARPGTVVSSLLGRSGDWPAPVVSDAGYAWKAAVRRNGPPRERRGDRRPSTQVVLVSGEATAVCAAPQGGMVFLGFANGEVAWLDAARNATGRLPAHELPVWPVTALSTDAGGRTLVVLHVQGAGQAQLASYRLQGDGYALVQRRTVEVGEDTCLTPVADLAERIVVGIWNGHTLSVCWGEGLINIAMSELPRSGRASAGLLITEDPTRLSWLIWKGSYLYWKDHLVGGGWAPDRPAGCGLRCPPVAWVRRRGEALEHAYIDSAGSLHWAEIPFGGSTPSSGATIRAHFSPPYQGYRAVTIVRPGFVAGVTARDGIHWLRRSGARLVLDSTTWTAFPSAVACFPSEATNELLVVCDGGEVVRLPVPQ